MNDSSEELLKTALYDLHVELGAKMVPFAGYAMPVQYPLGIVKEHKHTRQNAGLFDVSHMGQLRVSGANAAAALETLMPVDIIDLGVMKQRYALLTNEQGGIMDDLMVTNAGDHLFLVVNAACKQQDIQHLQQHIGEDCEIEVLADHALLALQGPEAAAVMARLAPESQELVFMTAANLDIDGIACFVTRSGYTGEDGFEISVHNDDADRLARTLMVQPEVEAVGLGARDSLRLEAGLCLYGHDLDQQTTPVESSLLWALTKSRRADGARPGGYPGADIIMRQISEGVTRKRVGLKPEGRMPVREGAVVIDADGKEIGHVSSGSFGPTVEGPVAMGYVAIDYVAVDTRLFALVRDKKVPLSVVKLPFVQQRYYRG
ncbi:MAG: glycine cleavage system aminomethyltransferase GcvT [Gammaproteobacteria bacterium]|nr:glycine cleavage system aminomethyltransferase GcvT [Gammaproteobacteria bacterium]